MFEDTNHKNSFFSNRDSSTIKNDYDITHPACDVVATSHIGRDVADHAETSSRRRNRYVNETDLFEKSLRRLTGT